MTRLQLIYIHGFQGDHTSFQAFPTDLHERLRLRLPSEIVLESCLYPTYKSRRPISEAAKKFIDWLATQPAGPVVLVGHSMGGLLAAEVATSNSHQSKRVIGLMAFDVPFLGMHPRVIISGIASLLPGDKESREKSEAELNDENVIKRIRGDDVDVICDNSLDSISVTTSLSPRLRPPLSHSSSSSFSAKVNDEWEAMKMNLPVSSSRSQNNLSPYEFSSSPSARSSSTSLVSSFTSTLGTHILSGSETHTSSFTAKLERAAERVVQWQNSNAPFLRWLRKHADDPLSAMTNWVVEHFQFGACMFDPVGLRERYQTLESWNGKWINIWTEVPARGTHRSTGSNEKYVEEGNKDAAGALPSNTADVFRFADMDEHASESDARTRAKARKAAEKTLRKEREKERKQDTSSARPARHFIVLPDVKYARTESLRYGSLEHWERFPIVNVDDEVEAHCGLFIRSRNPGYENLVERVADIMEECELAWILLGNKDYFNAKFALSSRHHIPWLVDIKGPDVLDTILLAFCNACLLDCSFRPFQSFSHMNCTIRMRSCEQLEMKCNSGSTVSPIKSYESLHISYRLYSYMSLASSSIQSPSYTRQYLREGRIDYIH